MLVTYEEARQRIHEGISAAEFLTPKRQGGKEYACPFCPSSDAVSEDKKRPGKWHCFSCGKDFDVLDVIERQQNMSKGDALRYACDRLGLEIEHGSTPRARASSGSARATGRNSAFSSKGSAAPPAEDKPLNIPPAKWQKMHAAAVNLPYLTQERGIPAEVIARHPAEIGYSEHAKPWGKDNRTFQAVIFLTAKNSWRYRFLRPVERFGKTVKESAAEGRHIGLWNPAALEIGRPVFVCEGILDALSIETAGGEAVALQGTGINALFDEIEKLRAAGKAVPVLVDALDTDAPGRKKAASLNQQATARGLLVTEGAGIAGECKDANDALRSDRAAFAERVAATEQAAETAAAYRKEHPVSNPETWPVTPQGIVNPAALSSGEIVFLVADAPAVSAIDAAGAHAVAALDERGLAAIMDELDKMKASRRATLPPAIVDCMTDESRARGLMESIVAPSAQKISLPVIRGGAVMTAGDNMTTPEQVAEIVTAARAAVAELQEKELQEYNSDTAACRLPAMLDYVYQTHPFAPTGFSALDKILDGGFYPGLYFVGAVSSLGKTTFVLQIADAVAAHGEDVLYFSLEMSAYEIMGKSISRLTHIAAEQQKRPELARTIREILTGSLQRNLTEAQRNAILDASGKYMDSCGMHIHITEAVGDLTAEDIRAAVEKHIRLTGRKPLVVIDYLQILAPSSDRLTDKQAVDHTVVALRQLARDKDVTIFAISSFNRDNYQNPVSTAALKESGNLEYSADIIFGLQFYGLDRDKERDGNDSKRRDRLECLRQAREADKRDGRPLYIQMKILKARCGYGEDCFFRYHPRYNHFEPCEKSEAEEWLKRATYHSDESEEERREKADLKFAHALDNMDGGQTKKRAARL